MPVAFLAKSAGVLHRRNAAHSGKRPASTPVQRDDVAGTEKPEFLGTEFLEIIPGKVQRKLACKRQISPQAKRAETVAMDTCSPGQVDGEGVIDISKGVH